MVELLFVHGGVSGTARAAPPLGYAVEAGAAAVGALDAIERAVIALEDDPALNAGYGAVLDLEGNVELDAGIADGASRRWAGVANVGVRHPISLARKVLEETPHVLLAGKGAMAFAAGMDVLDDTTPEQRTRWIAARAEDRLDPFGGPPVHGYPGGVDTVGAVALDSSRKLAAGSSTGGVFGKMPGRIGDSPVFGAGIYASADVAVVGTGVGELFLETLACLRVAQLVESGTAPQDACAGVIELLGTREPVPAGLLAVDARGRMGAAFRGGSWAVEGIGGPVRPAHIA